MTTSSFFKNKILKYALTFWLTLNILDLVADKK